MDNTQNTNPNTGQNTGQSPNQNTKSNNRPEMVIRDGSLKATVWRNEGDKGPYFTTSMAKTYSDERGNPKDTQNFSQSDLLRVAELGRETYGVINQLKRQLALEQSQSQTQQLGQQQDQQSDQLHMHDREAFRQTRRPSNGDDSLQTPAPSHQR